MSIFCSTRYKEKEKEGSDHLADERAEPSDIAPPPPLCVEWDFMRTFPGNQDAALK